MRDACQPMNSHVVRSRYVSPGEQRKLKVAARTSFGKIHSDFPLTTQGNLSGDEVNGAIGGGTLRNDLTRSKWTIEILKQ